MRKRCDLKKKLRVTFVGEAGLDMGGLTKEWFLLLVRQIFHTDYGETCSCTSVYLQHSCGGENLQGESYLMPYIIENKWKEIQTFIRWGSQWTNSEFSGQTNCSRNNVTCLKNTVLVLEAQQQKLISDQSSSYCNGLLVLHWLKLALLPFTQWRKHPQKLHQKCAGLFGSFLRGFKNVFTFFCVSTNPRYTGCQAKLIFEHNNIQWKDQNQKCVLNKYETNLTDE